MPSPQTCNSNPTGLPFKLPRVPTNQTDRTELIKPTNQQTNKPTNQPLHCVQLFHSCWDPHKQRRSWWNIQRVMWIKREIIEHLECWLLVESSACLHFGISLVLSSSIGFNNSIFKMGSNQTSKAKWSGTAWYHFMVYGQQLYFIAFLTSQTLLRCDFLISPVFFVES